MADNLHKDNFEEFLRKSFEEFDDSPSDALWGRIEGKIENDRGGAGYFFRKWWLAAVAALLLGIVVYQYIHYNKTIDALSDQLENGQPATGNQTLIPPYQSGKEIGPGASESAGESNSDNQLIKEKPEKAPENNLQQAGSNKSDKMKINTGIAGKGDPVESQATGSGAAKKNNLAGNMESIDTDERKSEATDRSFSPIPGEIAARPLRYMQTFPQVIFIPVTNSERPHARGKFSVGANYLTMNASEKISTVRTRSRPAGRMIFNANKSSGHTVYAGIQIERRFAGGWSLQSGAGYRRSNIHTSHRAKLRFADRVNTGPDAHEFTYDLNTTTGLVEVEIRAEQADPDEQIPSLEPISISVKTAQQLDYVSFPLLLKYQFSDRRLHVNAKAGFLGNILAGESLSITALNLINDKFRAINNATRVNDLHTLKKFTLDLSLGIELEYDLLPQWSVSISPTYMTSVSGNHNDRFIDSSERLLGFNFGTKYHF